MVGTSPRHIYLHNGDRQGGDRVLGLEVALKFCILCSCHCCVFYGDSGGGVWWGFAGLCGQVGPTREGGVERTSQVYCSTTWDRVEAQMILVDNTKRFFFAINDLIQKAWIYPLICNQKLIFIQSTRKFDIQIATNLGYHFLLYWLKEVLIASWYLFLSSLNYFKFHIRNSFWIHLIYIASEYGQGGKKIYAKKLGSLTKKQESYYYCRENGHRQICDS